MKKVKNKVQYGRPKLLSLVKKWRLSQPIIAEQMGMNWNTFKLKLNERAKDYNFTDEEYLEIVAVIRQLDNELHSFLKNTDLEKI